MDSPRLDVTHLQVVDENEVVVVTRKPMFFWVDLTTLPGKALAYEIDTKRCWLGDRFDPSRAVLRSQIPRPWPADYFMQQFKAAEGSKAGANGTYYHSLGEHLAVKMKHDFCSHSADLSRCLEGTKGDWLVFNGEVNIPVSQAAFENAFVKAGSYTTGLNIKEPQWDRDSFGMPLTGRRGGGLQADNVVPFKRRNQKDDPSADTLLGM
ncbi:hypothetical protein IFT48_04990 [Pseudomonas fluorescens]|uniref:hypothetical protein n=1 Tax=Pseudomonas TaxID=286 RepID=UPI000F036AB0|nr:MULTISPECIES: hypothetical protein [Pseudomonas]MBD8089331.1 hypothetical protein [Pseudomonas fluorescens]MBD8682104.1 hypothetical protein [Pseudomonas sp. CFBP 13719]